MYDFNTTDGITKYDSAWYTTSISGKKEPKSNVSNGSHLIENLTPGGIYVVEALWSYDMTGTVGGENSIHRYIPVSYTHLFSFPATSLKGTGTISLFFKATMYPYFLFLISSAAAVPKRVDNTLSYGQGAPPR